MEHNLFSKLLKFDLATQYLLALKLESAEGLSWQTVKKAGRA